MNYKEGAKNECGSPPYAIVPLMKHIERYRTKLRIPREEFLIWEPATGQLERRLTGLVMGFSKLGYPVFHEHTDFLSTDFDDIQEKVYQVLGFKVRMIVTNPPFSVSLKRRFIKKCDEIFMCAGIPWALLMASTTLVEKVNGKTMRGCSIHVPNGRICYNMPDKGWGTRDEPTTATFETNWYSRGLVTPSTIWYSEFNMSGHFEALDRFNEFDYNTDWKDK